MARRCASLLVALALVVAVTPASAAAAERVVEPEAAAGAAREATGGRYAGSRPNVVVLFVDDTGYGDYGFNTGGDVRDTPRLDALRARGMRLTDFHAAASVCTPSRGSMLTGRLGARTGVTGNFSPNSVGGLPLNETTIAEMLKGVGYTTAMAGKWHLGHTPPHGPPHRGFDSFMGTPLSHDYGCTNTGGGDIMCPHAEQDVCFPSEPSAADGPTCHIGPNNPWGVAVPFLHNDTIVEQPADLDALADRYADFAADFVADAAGRRQPFFLYLAWNHMHVPVGNHRPEFTNTSANGIYGDTIRQLDEAVGRVLDAVEDAGVDGNTLVLMTGDNGGASNECEFGGSNGPFQGGWLAKHANGGSTGKTTTWEGGHREPSLAVWPGRIAAGSESAALTSTLDYLPTLAALAGAPLPPDRIFDGFDLAPVLFGDGSTDIQVREALMHPNSGSEGEHGVIETVRAGRYKAKWRTGGGIPDCSGGLTDDTYHELPLIFDLEADVSETDALVQISLEYVEAYAQVMKHLRDFERSLAADNITTADYNGMAEAVPCCNPTHPFCVCELPPGGRNAVRLPRPLLSGL